MSNIVNYQSIESIQIYLNSANASEYYNGSMKSDVDFRILFPHSHGDNVIEYKLLIVDAQIPKSWYLINSTNCNLTVILYLNNPTTFYYKIPHGNYNIQTFITTFRNVLGSEWNLTYNSITNKIIFIYSVHEFSFKDDGNTIMQILGFGLNSTYTSNNKSLTSVFCYDFSGLKKLNIKSDNFNSPNIDSLNKTTNQIITSIPCDEHGSIIFYKNLTNYRTKINHTSLTNISIEITDDYNNYIDFHNIEWSMTIQIDIIKDEFKDLSTFQDIYNNEYNNIT